MKKLLLLLTLAPYISLGQTTAIPDANFEQALINLGYDNVIDGGVLTANISGVTSLIVSIQNISDLTGIEDFVSLTHLDCWSNPIGSIDVSQNINLILLDCSSCGLTSIDVSQNTLLNTFSCAFNQITELDISHLSSLTNFAGHVNQFTCLNVNNGNNNNFTYFNASGNSNLVCIEVDDVGYSTTNWTNVDIGVSFSTNCANNCSPCSNVTINDTIINYVGNVSFSSISPITYLDSIENLTIVSGTCDSIHNHYSTFIYNETYCTDTIFVTTYDTILTSVTDTLIIDITLTGIPLPNNTNTIMVYPNPASDVVMIDNGNYSTMTGYTLKIINTLGQEVFNSNINVPQFQIPVSNIGTEGLYYIEVFDDNNTLLETKKLVLN